MYVGWVCWVFVAAGELFLVTASGAALSCGAQASPCGSRSCCGAQALGTQALYLQHVDSVAAGHGLSCPVACEIVPD